MITLESQLLFSVACLRICANFRVFCRLSHLIFLLVSILLVGKDDDLLGFVSTCVRCVHFEFTFEACVIG